ncbi:isochorismate synthase [Amycolatopsis cihanbeyliensis]|uniref:isochorismate synthase n=1 Tax=Amycolatopsis cihanbeyliensis TaxID=1128664 RepID=A0A542DIB0_AMYCI|nr:isochorismate synthase [Amycolatopsis cihanbeyliensis]TQJ02831.1 isochorismate synthase [Amycolatopsis cihanbeyliensis]
MTLTPEGAGARADAPVKLLAAYEAGDFFLATERRTVLAAGTAEILTEPDPVRLGEQATAALAEARVPIAAGVLPFDPARHPSRVVLPRSVHIAGSAHPGAAALTARDVGIAIGTRPVPRPSRHREAVARAVSELRHGELRKVVLARALDVEFADPVRPEAILHNLLRENPHGYTFAAGLPGGSSLVGTSPELLVAKEGDRVFAYPHAGSAPRHADPATDRAAGEALLASVKDQEEHAVLAEAVVETLRPFCRKLDAPTVPALVGTPTMWHLGTTVTGELLDRDVTALRLAAALHPTPAVCGTPTGAARELLGRLEPFDRRYYAGAAGWVDAEGDGEWVVSIRCAEVAHTALRLYAGGGILAASDPEAELAETSAKFQTLFRAMGFDPEST